ncbi:ribokinase [Kitasatospora sp. NPDC127111]|uniref:ribokinase n=1 Tax=Kitasatospora sp. NPDC127111 TaxID=3345363 RepID=UPI0036414C1A
MYDYDLLVVGSANVDLVIGVERRPGAGETVLGSDLAVHPGGKGANQAVAAARLGARTALLARVGDDANGRLAPEDVRAAGPLFHASRVVSAQLEIPLESVVEIVRQLPSGTRFVLNPSPPQALPVEVLAACDPLIVNEHEARVILGGETIGDDPAAWVRELLASGPKSVVVTLGSEGALVASAAEEVVRVASVKVEAVDTTGAGDSFAAALAWKASAGASLAEAPAYAARVGAVAVTRRGAQESFPTAEEVEALCGRAGF